MADPLRRLDWRAAAITALLYVTLALILQGLTNRETVWVTLTPVGMFATVAAAVGWKRRSWFSIRTGEAVARRPPPARAIAVFLVVLAVVLAAGALYASALRWGNDGPLSVLLLIAGALQILVALAIARAAARRRRSPESASDPRVDQ